MTWLVSAPGGQPGARRCGAGSDWQGHDFCIVCRARRQLAAAWSLLGFPPGLPLRLQGPNTDPPPPPAQLAQPSRPRTHPAAGRSHGKATTFPRLADPVGFVPADDVFHAVKAVVAVQRDYGRRDDRKQASTRCRSRGCGRGCVALGTACSGMEHGAGLQALRACWPGCCKWRVRWGHGRWSAVFEPGGGPPAGAAQVPDPRVGHGQVPLRGGAVHGQEV